MHLAISGSMGNFYHLQMSLTAANHALRATAYLSKEFHRDVHFWQHLFVDTGSRPTLFAEIVQYLTTDVSYTGASCLGCGEVWIDPNEDGAHYVWHLPWPEYIMADLVSTDNTHQHITIRILSWQCWCFKRLRFLLSVPTQSGGIHSPEAEIHPLLLGSFGKLIQ